ncbi:acyltransferase [Cellulosimicrobium marinum]|uniref:acyltransferase n=1 Tax=Cellulosimicrobium marinum TaxID=1638992 RepID=UPI001E3D9E49|nr:acyltransferase [Cellulosimicrobium marinum]MCB7134990.1 acyltransferase [Cellulosimicrobium marinum]
MTARYDNEYPCRPDWPLVGGTVTDALTKSGVVVGEGTTFVGVPRVAFTQVTDDELGVRTVAREDFRGVVRVGSGCYVDSGVTPAFHSQPVKLTSVKVNDRPAGRVVIGDDVVLQGVAVVAYELVEIGDGAMFGPLVTIMDSSGHPLRDRGGAREAERITSAPVRVGEGAWVGTGATILKGVEVGAGSVVGAQSVVYESVPDGCVVVGNPARVVKRL